MNSDTICCQTPAAETTAVTREDALFAPPLWSASKHDKGIDLEVTLPGVPKDGVTVEIRGSHLHLEARRPVDLQRGRLIHGSPAPAGYRLKLRLGESLDGNALSATLNDGVLRVSIPLVEAAQPRKVEIL